jgi:hypothetical protein
LRTQSRLRPLRNTSSLRGGQPNARMVPDPNCLIKRGFRRMGATGPRADMQARACKARPQRHIHSPLRERMRVGGPVAQPPGHTSERQIPRISCRPRWWLRPSTSTTPCMQGARSSHCAMPVHARVMTARRSDRCRAFRSRGARVAAARIHAAPRDCDASRMWTPLPRYKVNTPSIASINGVRSTSDQSSSGHRNQVAEYHQTGRSRLWTRSSASRHSRAWIPHPVATALCHLQTRTARPSQ